MLDEGLGHLERSDDIDRVDLVVNLVFVPAELLILAATGNAGVVEQHVDRLPGELLRQCIDLGEIRHVEFLDHHIVVSRSDRLEIFRAGRCAACRNDMPVALCILTREFEADAPAGAGNQHGGRICRVSQIYRRYPRNKQKQMRRDPLNQSQGRNLHSAGLRLAAVCNQHCLSIAAVQIPPAGPRKPPELEVAKYTKYIY